MTVKVVGENMSKKRGLGLGLSELLSDLNVANNGGDYKNNKNVLKNLAIDLLQPGKYQPRRAMDKEALTELAASIRAQGIIQPLIVRPIAQGNYEIIAGERRWRAAQLAQLQEVPVVMRDIPDEQVVALSLIENIQRENLNAIDTAVGLQRLIDEFAMTHESAAAAVGKSRTAVTNLLRLLDLSESIKDMLRQSLLEMGHARALLALDAAKQLQAARVIVAKKLSVRAAEFLVRQLQKPQTKTKVLTDPNIVQLQKQLATKLAATVNIYHAKKGKGKIVIKYNSLDELDGILRHIQR